MAKAAFNSYYNRPETIPSPVGTEYDKVRKIIIDDTGHKVLKCVGETNRYQKIQAHKEECLIENILAKATMDPSILNQRNGQYFDATEMPKTLAEAQNKILEVKQEFEKLPVEVREKFGHSPERYVQLYGTKEWGEAVGLIQAKVEEAETKEETKKEDKE